MIEQPRERAPIAATEPDATNPGDQSLSTLFRRLSEDGRALVHQEIALARAEIQEGARSFAKDAALLGLGLCILLVGLLVMVAFLVVGLGALLGGAYWLSTLIVGGGLSLLGGVLALSGRSGLRHSSLSPQQAKDSIRDDKAWARDEIRELKRDFSK
jgi:Putative Actinobacterial Holin-X, holin superfamily III